MISNTLFIGLSFAKSYSQILLISKTPIRGDFDMRIAKS